MQKYALYDDNGKVIGFLDDSIHAKIPLNAIKITDNLWIDILNYPWKWKVDVSRKTINLAPPLSDKELDEIAKNNLKDETNIQISSLLTELSKTDWYALQEIEEGIPIPAKIKAQRSTLRVVINELMQNLID